MRQIGILAAAGLIALEDGPKRLHEDHENSKALANGVAEIPGISIDPSSVQTNIVIFDVSGTGKTSGEICARLKDAGVLAIGISDAQIRMVTHCDATSTNISKTIETLRTILT